VVEQSEKGVLTYKGAQHRMAGLDPVTQYRRYV
jgi:hypothetical protein